MSEGAVRGDALGAAVDPAGPLDVALLVKPTGTRLAVWTRHEAATDVLAVMAATLIASVETLVETLGGSTPESISVEAPPYRFLALRLDPRRVLFLAAPQTVRPQDLVREGERLARNLARPTKHGRPTSVVRFEEG